jgi:N6-adenosine-specific RNA methylase IME4
MKRYQLIVADPPWPIAKVKQRSRPMSNAPMDYPMMSMDEIKALPVHKIADESCILFLWTIDKYLQQTPDILAAWGFNYHLTMAWDKTNGMSMYGFNRRTEFCLVGLKGKHEAYPVRKTIRTSFTAKSEYHSAKPDIFYEMLDVLPFNPRLLLFARQEGNSLLIKNKWDVYGNEVKSDVEL